MVLKTDNCECGNFDNCQNRQVAILGGFMGVKWRFLSLKLHILTIFNIAWDHTMIPDFLYQKVMNSCVFLGDYIVIWEYTTIPRPGIIGFLSGFVLWMVILKKICAGKFLLRFYYYGVK